MNVEKYHLKSEETLTVFEFISEGPKGAIRKLIHFQPTSQQGIYNLPLVTKIQKQVTLMTLQFPTMVTWKKY
jgi:hypothetical protein